MIRNLFKKKQSKKSKIDKLLEKYNLPKAYLSVNRKMTTRGIGIGLFWGFIPMPMQMLAVISTTPFIKFNVPIAISMVWLSNPITMPFMYYMEYLTGNFILGLDGVGDISLTLDWFSDNLSNIFLPLYVGTAFYSIFITILIYLSLNWFWIYSVKKERKEQQNQRKKREKNV